MRSRRWLLLQSSWSRAGGAWEEGEKQSDESGGPWLLRRKEGTVGVRTAAVGAVRSDGILHIVQKTGFKRDPKGKQ